MEVLTALQALQLLLHQTQPRMVMLRFGQVMRWFYIHTCKQETSWSWQSIHSLPPLATMVSKLISSVFLGQFCMGVSGVWVLWHYFMSYIVWSSSICRNIWKFYKKCQWNNKVRESSGKTRCKSNWCITSKRGCHASWNAARTWYGDE